jgi:hypothetical protein
MSENNTTISSPETVTPPSSNETASKQPAKPKQQKPQPQAKKPTSQHKPASVPGIVDYHGISAILLKAMRHRRKEWLAEGKQIDTLREVRDFQTIHLEGGAGTGETTFVMKRFLEHMDTSVVILRDAKVVHTFQELIKRHNKGKSAPTPRIYAIQDVIRQLKSISPELVGDDKVTISIQVDPNDQNPAATIAALHEEYLSKQEEIRTKELVPDHVLRTVKTVLVDDWVLCEPQGLSFARLVRFARLGHQLPELILVG